MPHSHEPLAIREKRYGFDSILTSKKLLQKFSGAGIK
jgi:hypothetical protein